MSYARSFARNSKGEGTERPKRRMLGANILVEGGFTVDLEDKMPGYFEFTAPSPSGEGEGG